MIRKNWSEGDISAYLDGQLGAEARAAFEADLARDSALRRQVAALQATVALIRAVPLREPPRNYLLTPSMVTAPARRASQRPRPLLWMRLATSLTAVAFAISLTLNVLRGMTPAMAPQPMLESAPMVAPAAKEASPTAEGLLLEAPAPNEVVVEATTAASPVEDEGEQERAISAPEAAPPGMGEGTAAGMGAPPEAELDAMPATEGQPTPLAKSGEPAMPAATPAAEPQMLMMETTEENAAASSMTTLTQPIAVEEVALDTELETLSAPTSREAFLQTPAPFPPPWVTALLGVVTLILAGMTLWLWRRE